MIHEFLADPALGASGDANCDGLRDGTEDEFVEIANLGASPVDIGGWTISDASLTRHVFANGTTLDPMSAIVVFGGGMPIFDGTSSVAEAWCLDLPGVQFVVASSGLLALDNPGDTVSLSDAMSTVVDTVTYPSGVLDQSMTRSPELTAGAFDLHTNLAAAPQSPGTTVDFTPIPEPWPKGASPVAVATLAVISRLRRGSRLRQSQRRASGGAYLLR